MNRWLGLSFASCAALWVVGARAQAGAGTDFPRAEATDTQTAETARLSGYSALEQSVVRQQLAERQLTLDPNPEGKQIEDVQIVTLDVFDERDPMPDFVDVLHTTTQKRVIRRELLLETGSPYRSLLAQETARNLRSLIQLSIVLVVPTRGSRPNAVRVLVITKDVWSLRLNWLLQSSNAHINSLVLNPSEENLFGTHAIIGGIIQLDPATYSLGLSLAHRRLLGSHEQALLAANFIRNRDTGAAEGSFGEFRYGQPLYSLDTKWSWGSSLLWRHDIARRFHGTDVALDNGIPVAIHRDRLYGGYQLVRSFGRRFKYDLSIGVEAERRVYGTQDLSGYDARAVSRFRQTELPVSDQRVSPFIQLHAHRTDFRALIEVETLGLQEDFRLGHDLLLRLYPASSSLGSTRDLLGSLTALSYTFPVGDGLLRPLLSSQLEYASRGRDDALFQAALRFVSPRLGFGRLVLDGQFLDRFRNYLNRRFALGGDGRVRGYVVGAFPLGANLIAANAELRTTSIDIFSAQVGAATFYDVGDVNDDVRHFNLKQSAGVGLRVLFPEFDRIILRADWGFPLSPGYRTLPGAFFVSFGQAFSMPVVATPDVVTETL